MMPVTMRQGPIVFAHRGGGEEAPENTMSAFAYAYEAGIRHVETDAHVTADGTVVMCHDETVDRCYDGVGAISEMTWRELSKLRTATQGSRCRCSPRSSKRSRTCTSTSTRRSRASKAPSST